MAGAVLRSRTGLVALVAVGAVLGLVLVGVWFLLFRDVAQPTTVGEAVTTFRQETDERLSGPSLVPQGVYVYATDGFEKTDALTGVTHRYPDRSTITVTKVACGVQMRWSVLEGRSTTWTFCGGPRGWTVESQDERHTFFGRTERTTYTCRDSLFRPAGDPPGALARVACATANAKERGTQYVVGRAHASVAGRDVDTVHLRKTTSFTGSITGRTVHDFWLDRTRGVPVRIMMVSKTTNDSPIGDVHYDEAVTLRLVSLAPRR
jgi:hypothetical protein